MTDCNHIDWTQLRSTRHTPTPAVASQRLGGFVVPRMCATAIRAAPLSHGRNYKYLKL